MKLLTQATAIFALAFSAAAQGAPAGKVLTVAGNATLARAGQQIPLQAGAMVESGDILEVGDRSALQVRFTDDSVVALRANSQFQIEDYKFDKSADSDRSILGLLKGGMRTITGLIGKTNQKNYSVRTATSTIGIRGTHFTVVSCNNDCRNPDGSQGLNGTFGGVTDGRITVSNESGQREFGQQDFFHVASASTPPVRLLAPPAILNDRGLTARGRSTSGSAPAAGTDAAASAGTATDNNSGTQTSTSPQLTVQSAPSTRLTSPLTKVAATELPAVVGTNSLSNRISVVEVHSQFGPNGQPNGIQTESRIYSITELRQEINDIALARQFTNAATLAAELRAAPQNPADPFTLVGGSAEAGAYWGYSPPVAGSTNRVGDHVAFGDTPTIALPGAGTAQYKFIGGTPPTDNFGRTGSFSGVGGLLMDFAARQIKPLTTMTLSFGTNGQQATPTVYSIPTTATWSMTSGPQAVAGTTCTTGCMGSTAGTVNGRFTGASAQGYIAAVTVSNTQLNTSKPHVAGTVAVFLRP